MRQSDMGIPRGETSKSFDQQEMLHLKTTQSVHLSTIRQRQQPKNFEHIKEEQESDDEDAVIKPDSDSSEDRREV